MKCRTKEVREAIVKDYEIHVVAHVKLLNGQSKTSCTGNPLTDKYYCFTYQHKQSEHDQGTFLVGTGAAEHFLELTGQKSPPLFNPLLAQPAANPTHPPNATNTPAPHPNHNPNTAQRQWDPTSKELYNAINLLVTVWNTIPYGKLATIMERTLKYHYKAPFDNQIIYVNTIIGKDRQGRSLQTMLQQLAVDNNIQNLQTFNFDKLNAVLEQNATPSNFG